MSFAAPIVRDGFSYNGEFYAEVGNFNRHKRASIAEIKEILRPNLQKAKYALPSQSKDQVGHWYEAQLVHYGLAPSKNKAVAKSRLLDALNASSLVVPLPITRLEDTLRKEYNTAERKGRALHKARLEAETGHVDKPMQPTTAKKRKRPDPSENVTNPSIAEVPSPTKKAKPPSVKLQEKEGAAVKKTTMKSPEEKVIKTKEVPLKKQTASSKYLMMRIAELEKDATKIRPATGSSPVKKKSEVEKEKTGSITTKKSITKKEPAPKREPATKKEPVLKKEKRVPTTRTGPVVKNESPGGREPSRANSYTLGLINGFYDIDCPYISEQWGVEDLSLTLCLDSPRVWVAYDFGMFQGILLLPERPYQASKASIPCFWRGREEGEGVMSFGDGCVGHVSFLGGGRITGSLNISGDCHFTGIRRAELGTSVRSAASMEYEWDGYNQDAYDQESRNRWR